MNAPTNAIVPTTTRTPLDEPNDDTNSGESCTHTDELPSLYKLLPLDEQGNLEHLDPETALERFINWAEDSGKALWDHQEEALLDLASGNHVILGTPTGSGKSMVALGMCYFTLVQNGVMYYTAPIKALVSEKFFELTALFGKDLVGMITGDVVINSEAPLICCTAEILAYDSLRFGSNSDISAVCMDEFHYYADKDRGWAWQIPLLTLPHTQFLLMSATLGNMSALSERLERMTKRHVDAVLNAPRPVPLRFAYATTSLEASVKVALQAQEAPLYIVHFAQSEAEKSARALANFGISTKEEREKIKTFLQNVRFTTSYGKSLKHLLTCGVGIHHAGMLPRYRLLVEKLAQQGLLPVICGTDTLGVGINVPIHTVIFNSLTKFDGRHMRHLNAREFHQIAGRAGRCGFDTEGVVQAQATVYEIERLKAQAKAQGDPKKLRRIKAPSQPAGFLGWSEKTFHKLIESSPEELRAHLKISHALVLAEVMQQGHAFRRIVFLIMNSFIPDEEKTRLLGRTQEIFATLLDSGVIEQVCQDFDSNVTEVTDKADATGVTDTTDVTDVAGALSATEAAYKEDDLDTNPLFARVAEPKRWIQATYKPTIEIPEDFALNQPLAPFVLAALELLDPQSPSYALDVVSLAESALDNPPQIMKALLKKAKNEAMSRMKAEGIEYEERLERLEDVSYEKPLESLIKTAYENYSAQVPWARDFAPMPKSIVRNMLETACDFKTYVQVVGIIKNEGTLLRYLSDAWRFLAKTIPESKLDDKLHDIISWLHVLISTTDSSLLDEWQGNNLIHAAEPPRISQTQDLVPDRRGLMIFIHNALFQRVVKAAQHDTSALGELDGAWGWHARQWTRVLDEFYEAHDQIELTADARSNTFCTFDTTDEKLGTWCVRQMFLDSDGDCDFGMSADIDIAQTLDTADLVCTRYCAGNIDDLLEDEQNASSEHA